MTLAVAALAVFLLAAVTTFAATSRREPTLRYSAWSASSVEPVGCLGKRGLYTQLSATLTTRLEPGKLRKLAAKNRPREVSVKIGERRYRLQMDRSASVAANGQVIWGFKRVPLSAKTAKSLIGKKATISYKIGPETYQTKPVRTEDGRCKSLI